MVALVEYEREQGYAIFRPFSLSLVVPFKFLFHAFFELTLVMLHSMRVLENAVLVGAAFLGYGTRTHYESFGKYNAS